MKTALVLSFILNYLMCSSISGEDSYCSADKCVNIQPLEAWFEKVSDPQYGNFGRGVFQCGYKAIDFLHKIYLCNHCGIT